MNIGKLDTRCSIHYQATTQDPDYGTSVVTWTLLDTLWCNVQDVLPSKSETVANGIRQAMRPSRIRMRYRADITSDMRVTIHGPTDRVCQIVGGPAELGRRDGLEIVVETYTTQGTA